MTVRVPVVSAAFQLSDKGRTVLPVAVRRAAEIADGAPLVARADGRGCIVIETVEAIRQRIQANSPEPAGRDMVADVRELRVDDNDVADANAARRSVAPVRTPQETAAIRATLMTQLGL